ncbi:hypothetical protein [Roseovarius sp. MBR-6]|jgi:hypothetical protein|uniref:hypothetical protein n=1 Tax=Roseovarius sp. MBR-6 TaxID=3156459 RepID=UPI003399ED09
MWFNTRAALAEISGKPLAPRAPDVAKVAIVAAPFPEMSKEELARDIFEERCAIREFDGGQDRAEAERDAWPEAQRAAGITLLDQWRREADDPHNPDNWK